MTCHSIKASASPYGINTYLLALTSVQTTQAAVRLTDPLERENGMSRINTIHCSRDGSINERAYRAQARGPLSQNLCVKSLLCISYLWLKKVYFVHLLMALIECTCAVFLGVLRIPYAIYSLKMANLSLSWFSSFLGGIISSNL